MLAVPKAPPILTPLLPNILVITLDEPCNTPFTNPYNTLLDNIAATCTQTPVGLYGKLPVIKL